MSDVFQGMSASRYLLDLAISLVIRLHAIQSIYLCISIKLIIIVLLLTLIRNVMHNYLCMGYLNSWLR